jgi:hypothetical protein
MKYVEFAICWKLSGGLVGFQMFNKNITKIAASNTKSQSEKWKRS